MGNLLTDDLARLGSQGPGLAGRRRYLRDCRRVRCPCRDGRTRYFAARPKSFVRLRQALWIWLAGLLAESAWTLRNSITKVGPCTR